MSHTTKWNQLPAAEQEEILTKRARKFGELLTERRNRLNITQSDIAAKMGYIRGSIISAIENGRFRIPKDKAREFAHIYELDESRFFAVYIYLFHPDFWYMFCKMSVPGLTNDMLDEIEQRLDGDIDKLPTRALFDVMKINVNF